jgi:Lrp/AsnC family leucine-responsive transcriptional regulator
MAAFRLCRRRPVPHAESAFLVRLEGKKEDMDGIDRRIVEMLADNGRLSYAEMARKIGLSGPAVHERVGKLEAAGVITGYQALVDGDAVGLGVTAFIGIVQSAESDMDDVATAMGELPEVEACHFVAGSESFLIQVRVPTINGLEQLIVRLNRIPGVASTRTTIVLSTRWERRPQPLPAGTVA